MLSVFRSDCYDQEAERVVPAGAARLNPERATKRWLQGMSRNLRNKFPSQLRIRREELSATQQDLAEVAGLTPTAVAMIERGERMPNLDTTARLCWALDAIAGLTLEELA